VKNSFYEELKCVLAKFHKYHINILLGLSMTKLGREEIFELTVGKEILFQINNDNGIRAVNFAMFKNLTVMYNVPISQHP
jgi:hypothetical protein